MKSSIVVLLALISVSLGGCSSVPNEIKSVQRSSDSELIQALQNGGNVVYMRHTATEKDYADQITAEMNNCATQRSLSEKGWMDARMIGEAFSDFGIDIQKVYSSEYCRAWQTADLAFGAYEKIDQLNFYPAEEYTDEQFADMRRKVLPFLTERPKEGQNIVIVGHDDVFESATGIYPEPQGVMFLLKPNGGTFKVIGSIAPSEWPNL